MWQSFRLLADTITNSTAAQLTYQVGADSMIGGSGNYNTLTYPNPEQVSWLIITLVRSRRFILLLHPSSPAGLSRRHLSIPELSVVPDEFSKYREQNPNCLPLLHTVPKAELVDIRIGWAAAL